MVNKCAAINCRSGYSDDSKNPNVTFHYFPLNNEELSKIWLKNIARKDFLPQNIQDFVRFISKQKILENNHPTKHKVAKTEEKM